MMDENGGGKPQRVPQPELGPKDMAFFFAAMLRTAGGRVEIPKSIIELGEKLLQSRVSIYMDQVKQVIVIQEEKEKPPLVVVPKINPRIN